MSFKMRLNCLLCSSIISLLLFLQPVSAQGSWEQTDQWLKSHYKSMNGFAQLIVYQDGSILYNRTEGLKPGSRLKRIKRDKALPIASASKWLSAALIMTFVDEGLIGLHDTIGTYLPVFTEQGKGHIQLKHCLSHTTGFTDAFNENRRLLQYTNMDQAMAYIAQQPLSFEPGTAFHYGSYGLQIAAAVVEKISGKSFHQLFKERIATPLQMKDTHFGNKPVPLAAGGAHSTAEDLVHFTAMLLQDGIFQGNRVLSASAVSSMLQRYTTGLHKNHSPEGAAAWDYGLGAWIIDKDLITSPGLFGTFPWIDRKKGYAAVLYTYNLNRNNRREAFQNLVHSVQLAVKPAAD